MRTSYLPKKLVVVIALFLSAALVSASCTSRTTMLEPPLVRELQRRESSRININTASRDELESLPQVGPVLAEKIIVHRTRYGPFRKREHLLIVEGMSEKRFDQIEEFIEVDRVP